MDCSCVLVLPSLVLVLENGRPLAGATRAKFARPRDANNENNNADPYVVETPTFFDRLALAPTRTKFDLEYILVASAGYAAPPSADGDSPCDGGC